MAFFNEFQSRVDGSDFCHPLAPGAHGVSGYCRPPGPYGTRDFSNSADNFGALRKVAHPLSPMMKMGGSEEINKIEGELAYGPQDVPKTMRKKGWHVAANLIEHWLNGDAKIIPEEVANGNISAKKYGSYNTNIVSMGWVQSFPRAKSATTALETLLDTPNSRRALEKILIKNFKKTPISINTLIKVDNTQLDVIDLHENWQFQRHKQGSIIETPDALTAALGRFNIMAAILNAEIKNGTMKISKVGIYIRDIFDFSGGQQLGCWTDSDVYRLGVAPFCTPLTNNSFSAYRIKTGKGMDFLIFTDILTHEVDISLKLA